MLDLSNKSGAWAIWKFPIDLVGMFQLAVGMEEELRAHLAELTDAFVASTKLKASTVLSRAVKDARFLDRTGAGKTFTVRLYDTALRWFVVNWPTGAEWPDHIPRPVISVAAQADLTDDEAETAA